METTFSPTIAPAPLQTRGARRWLIIGLSIWSILVLAGLVALERYANAPGETRDPPRTWPIESQITRDGRPTLLLFAHPCCACTRATLAELARLAARCGDDVDLHALFIQPGGSDWSAQSSSLVQMAHAIPGVKVHDDVARREARRFHSLTSGTCLLYDRDGQLIFHGGLTPARGQEGANAGASAIAALVHGRTSEVDRSAVFGCPLFEENSIPTVADTCTTK
ncbi:MAG TPA: hypothetical protein VHD36_07585 [Pirellulales bacterium]|nr:hypothetical protein [Pirellulales bacterium]